MKFKMDKPEAKKRGGWFYRDKIINKQKKKRFCATLMYSKTK